MTQKNRQWLIAARPLGRELQDSDFEFHEADVNDPSDGEVLVKTSYLGFDPALKSWMENIAGYVNPTEIGDVMRGTGVGTILKSKVHELGEGDVVCGPLGWQEFSVVRGEDVEKVPLDAPASAALGVLGTTGRTAYFGLLHIGKPKPGDVLVISGAAGATGSVVGQIGKICGCTVIGIAGGPEKCAWLVDDLGFDAAIDYKSDKVRKQLRELAPNGVDIFFDNVGGEVLNDGLGRLAQNARVVICGGISRYNYDPRDPEQMPPGPRNYFNVVHTGATIQGFLLPNFRNQFAVADARLLKWVQKGDLQYKEDILEGLENAPQALMRIYKGGNFGKQLLRL